MKVKITAVALLAAAAGVFAYTRPHNAPLSDLRDAVSDSSFDALKNTSGVEASDIRGPEQEIKPFYVETGSGKAPGNKGYVAGIDPSAGAPTNPVEYVTISGGKFTMGTDSGEAGFEDAKPIREVTIKTFEMAKTAVTAEQYAECVTKGGCTKPATHVYCNWGKTDRQLHPVNCVDWDQAQAYAKFKGARLPSEAEFEYAATSGGKNQKYPWGNAEATSELAVMNADRTMPVCSKSKGNTAQGLCDMSGNVWQWVQDTYQDSYKDAPVDGSAFEGMGSFRVLRGGCFSDGDGARYLRADNRRYVVPGYRFFDVGFRLARSLASWTSVSSGDCTLRTNSKDNSFVLRVSKMSSDFGWAACPSDNPGIQGLVSKSRRAAKECAGRYGVNLEGANVNERVYLSPLSDYQSGAEHGMGYCVVEIEYGSAVAK